MRIPVIITMCVALVGVATAQTLTIQTEPSGQELWRGEENLGIAPVTLEGPFDGPLVINVEDKDHNVTSVIIEVPENSDNVLHVISNEERKKGFSPASFIVGIVSGIVVAPGLWFLGFILWLW